MLNNIIGTPLDNCGICPGASDCPSTVTLTALIGTYEVWYGYGCVVVPPVRNLT
jgi:hypothetical protein